MTEYYLERMANEQLSRLRAEAALAALLRRTGPRRPRLRQAVGDAVVRAGRWLRGEVEGPWAEEPGRLR